MLKEAMEFLLSKAPIERFQIEGREYTSKALVGVQPPEIDHLQVSTLSGLTDLISEGFEGFSKGTVIVHVVDHTQVELIDKASDIWARRTTFVTAKLTETKGFPFGNFLDHESFVIGLLSGFVPGEDLEYVVKLASNLTNEAVSTSQDNGISQTVGVKQGVYLKEQTEVKQRVKLAPYRTFREVEQPSSEFILRASQNNPQNVPKLALFEADGGKWKIDAMANVARYLAANTTDIPVVS